MMSYFCGCHALVMLLFIVVLAYLAAGEDNPLFELSSRDEVVQIAGYGEEKLSTVLITGSVNCEARDQPHAWPVQGASVAVNCNSHGSKWKGKSMVARGVTDEFGDFMVDLPSHLHAIPNLEKICTVKIHRIPKESLCRPAHIKKHKGLWLSSFGNGIRTYNAGNIRIQHATSEPLHAARKDGGNA
ncbi:Pollen Ole e 1 allergen/extensin [Spatholobus suberectus]|nr:Pollen Ole e 1 allergen/extensin [Spatholobus suberectus]